VQLRDHICLGPFIVDLQIEPFVELIGRGKDIRQKKVQQSPELVQIILQWRPKNGGGTGDSCERMFQKQQDAMGASSLLTL
jgi:hypothetical protein